MNSHNWHVGLIGLGLLGLELARRLLNQGATVIGYDHSAERRELFRSIGGAVSDHAGDVFDRCDNCLLCLPDSSVVVDVVDQCQQVIAAGTTIIDTTTGDPDQMVALAQRLAAMDIDYIEANIAGSSAQVADGSAVLLLGGSAKAIDSSRAVIDAISPHRFHVGGHGAGARCKLVHNLVLGLHRAVLAEGLSLARSLGLDEGRTLEILRHTPAASRVMETKGKKMVDGQYNPQARLSQHLKDVRLILDQAQRNSAFVPLSALHCELLQQAEALSLGDLDNSAIRDLYRRRSEDDPS